MKCYVLQNPGQRTRGKTGATLPAFIRKFFLHGSHPGDDAREGDLPQLGNSLQGKTGVRRTLSSRVARQDSGGRRAPPGGVLLPAVRRVAGAAPGSAARTAGR